MNKTLTSSHSGCDFWALNQCTVAVFRVDSVRLYRREASECWQQNIWIAVPSMLTMSCYQIFQ